MFGHRSPLRIGTVLASPKMPVIFCVGMMLKHVKTILLVTWAGTTHAWIRFHHYYRNLPETGWGSPKFNGLALCFLKNWLIYFWNPFPMGASLRSSGPPLPCEALSACGNSRDLSNETVASIMGIFLDTLYVLIYNIYICIWLYEYVFIYIIYVLCNIQ